MIIFSLTKLAQKRVDSYFHIIFMDDLGYLLIMIG